MGREFELKYRADGKAIAAIRAKYGKFTAISMETTYYDTAEKSLGALRWTLRRRLENGVSVCTLKTPASGGGRGEWETKCEDILESVPILCNLGAPKDLENKVKEGIFPLCGAKFTRLAKSVSVGTTTLELALDSGFLLGGGKEEPLCEVEVELKSGSEEAAVAFAESLAAEFKLIPEATSKFKRALMLTAE